MVHFQANEKCQALAGILHSHMGDRVLALAFITAGDIQLDFGQLRKRGVIRVGSGRRGVPVRFLPVQRLGLTREPVEVRSHDLSARIFQSQREEVSRAQILNFLQGQNFIRTVRRSVQCFLLRKLLSHVQVEDFCRKLQTLCIRILTAHNPD